jgi:3-dehydroquinate synthase
MQLCERTIQVSYQHRVYFTEDVFAAANPLLGRVLAGEELRLPRKTLVTMDAGLAAARPGLTRQVEDYFGAAGPALRLVAPPVLLEGGEQAKNSWERVWHVLGLIERHGICRRSCVAAVGGGAHLDVAGLAAATAHRGVRLVRIPSTTLAQADSGVGLKNAINGFGKKNFVGTFAPPFAVINDSGLLSSLSARDKRAGYAEAVKVACLRDRDFFEALEHRAEQLLSFEPGAMRWAIRRSAELHLDHLATSGDPFEFGTAKPLDFGHWAAHKLEQMSGYRLRHGEAVAVGLALDTLCSREKGWLEDGAAERVLQLLEKLGFELWAEELQHQRHPGQLEVLDGLEEFREHLGGELTITLLRGLGQGANAHSLEPELVAEAIQELAQRRRS